MSICNEFITNQILFDTFVSPSLEKYFYKKLKDQPTRYVKLKLYELLKFLMLAHHSYGNIPINNEIDEMWHLWILQTIQYQELMDKLPTKKFIHHSSNDYKDDAIVNVSSIENEVNNEFSYLVSYVENFGNFTEESAKFWPMINSLMDVLKLDLESLNNYLRDISIKEKNYI